MGANNIITDAANAYLLKHFDAPGKDNHGNPFYNDGEELYMKYDSISIKNSSNIDGGGLEVGYYWKGVKVAIFPVGNVRLDFFTAPSGANILDLDGIAGAMRIIFT